VDNVMIGERRLLSSDTFLIPKGETCEFKLNVTDAGRDYSFPIHIFFDDNGGTTQSVSFKPDPITSSMKMTLHNWNNSLGSALKEFYPIVNIENRIIVEMLMLNRRLGDVNELVIQFWRKDSEK
ncbi:hypothetical protein VE584_003255, partial [Salmonella enterica subsp. enterica serovar Muenchen]|nr:hypothetical protein [Salmonella enterica subsp. enterica serovar Muenchen]